MAHRHLVLIGAGYAHLQVLHGFAASQPADVDISVVWPHGHVVFAPMLPGLITGRYSQADCSVAIAPLLAGSRIRHVQARVQQIDLKNKSIALSYGDGDSNSLPFDYISIDWPSALDKAAVEVAMPGARAHGLFVQPAEGFVKYWPDLAAHAGQSTLHEGLNMAVVGAGMQAVALALALQQALPRSRISLVGPLAAFDGPRHAQQLAAKALARHGISCIQDTCVGIEAHQLRLASGMRLRCDAPVVALDESQFADPSKPSFEAAQGPALLTHLRVLLDGRKSKIPATKSSGLHLIEIGARNAIAVWGFKQQFLMASGQSVWHWNNVRNQRWIRPFNSKP
jgi:NADH dehydrogenase FAD-containing subunit